MDVWRRSSHALPSIASQPAAKAAVCGNSTSSLFNYLQGSVGDTAEALSALAGSHDGASELFLYLNKLGISGAGLLEVSATRTSSHPVSCSCTPADTSCTISAEPCLAARLRVVLPLMPLACV